MPSSQLVCSNIPNVHRCIRYTYVDSARAAPVDTLENRAQLTSAERKAEFERLRAEYEEEQQRRRRPRNLNAPPRPGKNHFPDTGERFPRAPAGGNQAYKSHSPRGEDQMGFYRRLKGVLLMGGIRCTLQHCRWDYRRGLYMSRELSVSNRTSWYRLLAQSLPLSTGI